MAGIVGLFTSVGEHMPMFRKDKQLEACPESWVNRLHYRLTCLLLLVCTMLVTCTEWISGTESIIDCMHGPGIPATLAKWYCYIQVTRHEKTGEHLNRPGKKQKKSANSFLNLKNVHKTCYSYKAIFRWLLVIVCIL